MIAEDIVTRQGQLSSDRANLDSHLEEISELVLPRYKNTFLSPLSLVTKGDKRRQKQFDATPELSLNKFAAAMEYMLTPRTSRWHGLVASDPALNKDRETALWFDDVTNILFRYRYSPKANFASQQHENYVGLGAFGTSALFVDELDQGGIRYKSIPLGNVWFCENHQGHIDTAYRRFPMTARNIISKWGNVPDNIIKAMDKTPDKEFDIIHCVKPRKTVEVDKKDFRRMPFASYYVSVEDKQLLQEGGYFQFPYAISRYVTAPGEVYGRSPAMMALPSIKTLNEEKKTVLKQGHRVVDPVILAHDDGVMDTFSLKAGAINYGSMTRDGKRLVDTLPTGNLAAGFEMMAAEQNVINDAFLVTLFQILVETPQMTATEVLERAREKGALLSPTMGRQQSEGLGPMIERELDILNLQGLLPPLPPALVEAQGEYEIEYDSPLSRAQKAEEASGMFRSMEFATAYTQNTGDPTPFDWINVDEAMPAVMKINAVPERWKNSVEDVLAIREGRQQQAEEQKVIEAAPAVAGLMKNG